MAIKKEESVRGEKNRAKGSLVFALRLEVTPESRLGAERNWGRGILTKGTESRGNPMILQKRTGGI